MELTELAKFRERLIEAIQTDPQAAALARAIRRTQNGPVEDHITNVFWAFCQPRSRELLEQLAG